MARHLATQRPEGLIDLIPAATSVLLEFNPDRIDDETLLLRLEALAGEWSSLPASPPEALTLIPFCADPDLAPDLESLAAEKSLEPRGFLERFCAAEFTVDFLGFMPGFAYLRGLPGDLAASRLERPRTRVPAGSVGIGGDRAGVYPFDSPGGWRLIGRTPLTFFDPARQTPALLSAGMAVRFVMVPRDRFEALRRSTPPVP